MGALHSDSHHSPRDSVLLRDLPPLSPLPDRLHLLWWALGIATYGVGTATEAATTLLGWREPIFRAWYVSGALLGGAPLAQGTVYLLLSRRVAHVLTALLLTYVAVARVAVYLSPIDYAAVETHRLSGRVLGWQWVRMFSPVVNLSPWCS